MKTPGGHWRFLQSDVDDVRTRMAALREKNARGDLELPDDLDEGPERPLL